MLVRLYITIERSDLLGNLNFPSVVVSVLVTSHSYSV
jgi:hypothetical protein